MHHLLNIVLKITMCIIQVFYHSHQNFELATSQQIETEKLSIKTAPTYKNKQKINRNYSISFFQSQVTFWLTQAFSGRTFPFFFELNPYAQTKRQ